MKIITVNNHSGSKARIVIAHIVAITDDAAQTGAKSVILMAGGTDMEVVQTPEEIIKLIKSAVTI